MVCYTAANSCKELAGLTTCIWDNNARNFSWEGARGYPRLWFQFLFWIRQTEGVTLVLPLLRRLPRSSFIYILSCFMLLHVILCSSNCLKVSSQPMHQGFVVKTMNKCVCFTQFETPSTEMTDRNSYNMP